MMKRSYAIAIGVVITLILILGAILIYLLTQRAKKTQSPPVTPPTLDIIQPAVVTSITPVASQQTQAAPTSAPVVAQQAQAAAPVETAIQYEAPMEAVAADPVYYSIPVYTEATQVQPPSFSAVRS